MKSGVMLHAPRDLQNPVRLNPVLRLLCLAVLLLALGAPFASASSLASICERNALVLDNGTAEAPLPSVTAQPRSGEKALPGAAAPDVVALAHATSLHWPSAAAPQGRRLTAGVEAYHALSSARGPPLS